MYPLFHRVIHNLINRGLSIFLCIVSIQLSFAQSAHQIFEHLTTDHGLSSNKVEAILQDQEGFYWIATQNGLNRFDGSSFKIFQHHPDDSNSLSHNYCTTIVEDHYGDIWIATYKGVSRYIKKNGSFQRIYFHHPSRNFEITNRIYNLAVDGAGNIWIGGRDLWQYDVQNDTILLFQNRVNDPGSIPPYSFIKQIVFDKKNNGIWFTTDEDIVFYSISKEEFHHRRNNPNQWKVFDTADNLELAIDSTFKLWFRDDETQVLGSFDTENNLLTLTPKKITQGVKQLSVDDKNRIWIFYWESQTEIFDPSTNTTSQALSIDHKRSALSNRGTFLFIDSQNNYWIASGNGISIFNERNQFYKPYTILNQGNAHGQVIKITSLAQTDPEHLWVGTTAGLFRYHLINGHQQFFRINSGHPGITTLLADNEKLWIGIKDHVWCLDAKTGNILNKIFIGPGVFFIRKGTHDDLWIGLWSGGLCNLDVKTNEIQWYKKNETGNSLKSVNLITGTVDGQNIWIGYNGGVGFSKFSFQSKTWIHFHPQESDISNSNAGTVTVITKGLDENLWLGTHGSGVFRSDPIGNSYENYDQFKGLKSNYINSIIPDPKGNLWISTADGMNYLNIDRNSIRSLDMGLVFADNDFAANGLKGLDNKLYFFANNQFVEVKPSVYMPETSSPRLVISSFKIFDDEYAIPSQNNGIHLSHRENFFSFQYSTIRTHPFKDVGYAYKLEGFDKDWIDAGYAHSASYTNVPHGNYIFLVKTKNEYGEWTDALISIPIQIKPPFWKTWWFLFLSAVVFISGIYGYYRYRIQQLKKIYAVRAKISQDLHDDIGASLSSIHFNSSIAEQQVKNNPDKAKEILRQINRNTRQVIENVSDIIWANNSGQKDKYSLAGRIKNYGYDLLSQKNIDCKYSIDLVAERKLSNPEARRNILLIIKEAMNNIAKYSEADHAEVNVSVNGPDLTVNISDNGKGFNLRSNGHGNGLSNMRKRTESIGGHFEIQSIEGEGTSIHCRIPLPNISEA